MSNVKFFYLGFIALIFLSFTDKESSCLFSFTGEKTIVLEGQGIKITNENTSDVSFIINLNDNFPLTTNKILDSIFAISNYLNIDTPMAAWHYVSSSTFHTTPFSEKQWLHNPFLFSNSVVSGFCDDLATYLVHLWKLLGFEARVWGLKGHVVAEVYHNGKWKVYDPDLRVFYKNSKNEVSSLKELETDGFSINNPVEFYFRHFNLDDVAKERYNSYYLSSNKNITHWQLTNTEKIDTFFSLPSYSSLSIYYDSISSLNLAVVELSKNSKGLLNIPLVPFCVEGQASYKQRDINYILNSENFDDFLKNYSKIKITGSNSKTRIYYIINPYLNLFYNINSLSYNSSKKIKLSSFEVKKTAHVDFLNFWIKDKRNDYEPEIKLMPYIASATKEFKESVEDFNEFNRVYSNSQSYEEFLEFKNEIRSEMNIKKRRFNKLIKNNYPYSNMLIYSSFVKSNKNLFIEKIKLFPEK